MEDDWEIATGGKVFHLADFGQKHCMLGSREWGRENQQAFLHRLAAIVNRPGCYLVSASIEIAPYIEFIQQSPNAHVNGPAFSGCSQACIAQTEFLLEKDGRAKDKVHYLFEKGDRQHELAKMVSEWEESNTSNRLGLRELSFEPKECTLLQPADLVAGIIQRCLIAAHSVLPCLDNGLSRTALHNYERFYSSDGLTATLVNGHDHDHCWIMNQKTFRVLDNISTQVFDSHPELLEKRLKQSPYKPKPKFQPIAPQ
jgi:hypothetical protein